MEMVFVTGDTHGDWKSRLNKYVFPEGVELTKDDYVIICGDFGIWMTVRERMAISTGWRIGNLRHCLLQVITAIMIYWTIFRWRNGMAVR